MFFRPAEKKPTPSIKTKELKGIPPNYLFDCISFEDKLVFLGTPGLDDITKDRGKALFICSADQTIQILLPNTCNDLLRLTDHLLLCQGFSKSFIVDTHQEKIVGTLENQHRFKACALKESKDGCLLVCSSTDNSSKYKTSTTEIFSCDAKAKLTSLRKIKHDREVTMLCASASNPDEFVVAYQGGTCEKFSAISGNRTALFSLSITSILKPRWDSHPYKLNIIARPNGGYIVSEQIIGGLMVVDESGEVLAERFKIHEKTPLHPTINQIDKLYLLPSGQTETLLVTFQNADDRKKIAVFTISGDATQTKLSDPIFYETDLQIEKLIINSNTGKLIIFNHTYNTCAVREAIHSPLLERVMIKSSFDDAPDNVVHLIQEYLGPRI